MTETPEIPAEAYERATDAIANLVNSWPSSASHPFHPDLGVRDTLRLIALYALEAAFPEPTFTASEVKELTTKATEVALALGRKEMLTEVLRRLEADGGVNLGAVQRALRGHSQPAEGGSERPTTPTGHSDLPPTPEAFRLPQEPCMDPECPVVLMHSHPEYEHVHSNGPDARDCTTCDEASPDLPEGGDQ